MHGWPGRNADGTRRRQLFAGGPDLTNVFPGTHKAEIDLSENLPPEVSVQILSAYAYQKARWSGPPYRRAACPQVLDGLPAYPRDTVRPGQSRVEPVRLGEAVPSKDNMGVIR
jgi:hypothetical protein